MTGNLRLDGDTLIYDHPPPTPELRRHAQLAIDCQDGCNACGIAQALAEAALTINREPNPIGTELTNQHPILWLFTDKLLTLHRDGYFSGAAYGELRISAPALSLMLCGI